MGLRERLVGTFELVSMEAHRSDGDILRPLGQHPAGTFVFDSAGRFSVQLMDPIAHPGRTAYIAMFGNYAVDEAAETFTLMPVGALDPTMIGTEVLRHVSFVDDVVVFSTEPLEHDGHVTTTYITWRLVATSQGPTDAHRP